MSRIASLLATLWLASASTATLAEPQDSFTNPLLPSGPDPWVLREGA